MVAIAEDRLRVTYGRSRSNIHGGLIVFFVGED